ncbi:MAG TPA: Hsp20/alpha crystallin family protein [Ramlibacter sp.]|nr:Hsp20/alpha crystallin family protein [Ramlibacter sp.]
MTNAVQTTSTSTPARSDTSAAGQAHVLPPVDVYEDDTAITLLADLPGVPRDQLQVRIDGDSLLLEATAVTAGPQDMELVYGEAQCPSFRRQFTLSRELDASRIEAQLRDGVLRISVAKRESSVPRRIEVS